MLDTDKLKELMKEKSIKSVKELSIQTGLPIATLYYMLSGHDMYVSSVVALSKFFNVPVDYLIKKYHGVMCYSEEGEIFLPTSSLVESVLYTMM